MTGFPIIDDELISRIIKSCTDNSDQNEPGVEKRYFGMTVAIKASTSPWKNGVFNFNSDDLHHLDDILAFYEVDGLHTSFYLLPTGFSSDLAKALTAAGYYQADFKQALLYGVPLATLLPYPEGITVETVSHRNIDIFSEANVEGFEYPVGWRESIKAGLHSQLESANTHLFLARCEGEPAGTAIMTVRNGMGSLSGGSVVPGFRGKGCQLALILHRMHIAHQLGCNLIGSAAEFGSTSFRNQQRAGLRLAFIESGWKRL
jgi:hypothetical protein